MLECPGSVTLSEIVVEGDAVEMAIYRQGYIFHSHWEDQSHESKCGQVMKVGVGSEEKSERTKEQVKSRSDTKSLWQVSTAQLRVYA